MVEATTITHFIADTHQSLVNEFLHTRFVPFQRVFLYLGSYNSVRVATDKEIKAGIANALEWKLKN